MTRTKKKTKKKAARKKKAASAKKTRPKKKSRTSTSKSSKSSKSKASKSKSKPKKKRKKGIQGLLADCPDPSNPKELRRTARKVLAMDERDSGPHLSEDEAFALRVVIAESYWGQGELRRAQREYLRLLESRSRNAVASVKLGLIAELYGETKIAEQHYQQALTSAGKEERAGARVAYARFLRRHGSYKDSLKLLKIAARAEGPRSGAAAEAAYVEALLRGHDPEPLNGWRNALQRLSGDDPVFSYFLGNLDLWDGRPMEGVRRLRAFVARMETATPGMSNTLYFEGEHARRILVRIESAQSVQMP